MSTDEPDHGGDVLDSWEELEDTSVKIINVLVHLGIISI